MPTDRVHCHRQQAQTRKRAVNAGTTRPPQARRSHTTTTRPEAASRAQPAARPQNPGLHNVSVTWARQVVALTLSCAAGPYRWSMGTPAHAPPIGLTCASKGPSTHPSGRHAIQQRDDPGDHNMSSSPTSAPWSTGRTQPRTTQPTEHMPSNSGTTPGTTTCPPAPHRHRGPAGAPRPEPHGPESTAGNQVTTPNPQTPAMAPTVRRKLRAYAEAGTSRAH